MHDDWVARGVYSANRLLIYGLPGTGKTTIASTDCARLEPPARQSDALVSSLLGQTSRNIRNIFNFVSSTRASFSG